MQFSSIFFSPAFVFLIFLLVGWLLLAVSDKVAARSDESTGKHLHYSCGEDLEVPSLNLNYHQFFRLALLFGILHIVALVIATIPAGTDIRILPIVYLVSAGIGMFILLEREHVR